MNKDKIKRMANTCENYRSCALCPYNPEDISRFIGDRWEGGCPNYDRKLVYAMSKGYRKVDDDEVVLKLSEVDEFRKDQAEVKFLKHKIEREAVEEFARIVVSVIFEDEENEKIKIRDVHDTIRDILRMHYDLELEDKQ